MPIIYNKIEINFNNIIYIINKMELNNIVSQVKENNNWKSESRIVGEACEYYIKSNIKCVRCNDNNFEKCKTNEQSKDLICISCNQKFQVKAKSATQKQVNHIKNKNKFKTIGGEYSTTLKNINEQIDYFIILYEKQTYKIINILYIKNENINSDCIIPRKPLSITAKRAGWQGCNILFDNIQIII
jgi:type II restriction enzyme